MAVCRDCDQEMTAGVGCTAFPGRELVDAEWTSGANCHDCNAPVGTMHHPGCDVERCDHGNQAIGGCPYCDDYLHLPSCERSVFFEGRWQDCNGCGPNSMDYWERIGTGQTEVR